MQLMHRAGQFKTVEAVAELISATQVCLFLLTH